TPARCSRRRPQSLRQRPTWAGSRSSSGPLRAVCSTLTSSGGRSWASIIYSKRQFRRTVAEPPRAKLISAFTSSAAVEKRGRTPFHPGAHMKTRAAVAFEAKKPLELVEVDLEGPRAGEVLVEIKATGVCHTDAYTLDGFDSEGTFPSILGHEGAGVVVEV